MSTLLIVLIILMVLGAFGYSSAGWWGPRDGNPGTYWPGGLIGIVVLILLLKVLGVV